ALPGSPGQAGEYCHGWAGSLQRWHRGFQCPERYDSPKATLCCGTCTLRYCCSSREARLDPVPVYLPFLLVGSVFVAFVVGGACVGICCCKCLKSQDQGQRSGLTPGQTWLLEPDLPSRLSSASSATRSSLSSGPQTSSICTTLPPPLPTAALAGDPRFLNHPPSSGQLPQPSRANRRPPPARPSGTAPAPLLAGMLYGHGAEASP
ncbi:SHSA1 protein, partial [Chloroceryle aenea]|nr:SHSA1 protein [Chloroceryle aenea]